MSIQKVLRAGAVAAAILGFTASASALMARDYSHDIVRHQDEMRACMGDHRGTVTIAMAVRGDGHLERAEVSSASSDGMRAGGECVIREARSWTFQRSTSGRHASYQLTATDRAVQVRAVPPRTR